MTVQDLILFLEKLPKQTQVGVVYRAHSDYSILGEDEMEFIPAPSKDELDCDMSKPSYSRKKLYVLRYGKLMEYDARTWDQSETPVFVPVLRLPGN